MFKSKINIDEELKGEGAPEKLIRNALINFINASQRMNEEDQEKITELDKAIYGKSNIAKWNKEKDILILITEEEKENFSFENYFHENDSDLNYYVRTYIIKLISLMDESKFYELLKIFGEKNE